LARFRFERKSLPTSPFRNGCNFVCDIDRGSLVLLLLPRSRIGKGDARMLDGRAMRVCPVLDAVSTHNRFSGPHVGRWNKVVACARIWHSVSGGACNFNLFLFDDYYLLRLLYFCYSIFALGVAISTTNGRILVPLSIYYCITGFRYFINSIFPSPRQFLLEYTFLPCNSVCWSHDNDNDNER
jgi:hypothetical protein